MDINRLEMKVDYTYLRPQKAAQLKNWYANKMVCKESLSSRTYSNATVLPLREDIEHRVSWGVGGVVDEDNNYIKDSGVYGLYDRGYHIETPEICHKEVVYLGYFRKHWGHFLMDCTNRLWYYLQHPDAKYIYITDEETTDAVEGNYREFLVLLGIWDHLQFVSHPVRFDSVIIPESSFDRETNSWSPKFTEVFRKAASHAIEKDSIKTGRADRIFLTRSSLPKACRQEFGMEMVDSYFRKNGYQIVSPEIISLSEMICLINHAHTVAAFSGTLPHNMLFGKDGQKLIVIERNALNNRNQHYVGQMKQLDTIYIDANYSIYPVELAYGPFIYGYTNPFRRFTKEKGYLEPDEKFVGKVYLRKLFRKYMNAYTAEHSHQWYMGGSDPWMLKEIRLLYEAYQESAVVFAPWICGKEPYKVRQLFEVQMLKQLIKKLVLCQDLDQRKMRYSPQ